MALRLGAERAAVPLPDEPTDRVATSPSVVTLAAGPRPPGSARPDVDADRIDGDDDTDDIFDTPDGDFYADAFEVFE